jgi:signal transduction histidine kinase
MPTLVPRKESQITLKCKLLPHLGNSIAFSVDKKSGLTYDFCNLHVPGELSADFPPRSSVSRFCMTTAPKNACAPDAPQGASKPVAESSTATRFDSDLPSPENLLQEYSELRERLQRTTNALASAAHDLKTPLSILNGYVELLQSEKLGPLNDRQREVLRDMRTSGLRLQQFIQDFLTYSAVETGGLHLHFLPGNINDCLSEVSRLWSNKFQEKGLALYFLANDELPVFPFDSPKLERVISNLLENSFKFTPQGGTVWLHAEPHMWERRATTIPAVAPERRRQPLSQPNAVKVSVSDTGPGIPAEFHLEVFDDFFRLPGNESEEGMGLGLAIARRLVGGMGGKIWVESEPGAGCKFSFLIPYKPSAVSRAKERIDE